MFCEESLSCQSFLLIQVTSPRWCSETEASFLWPNSEKRICVCLCVCGCMCLWLSCFACVRCSPPVVFAPYGVIPPMHLSAYQEIAISLRCPRHLFLGSGGHRFRGCGGPAGSRGVDLG